MAHRTYAAGALTALLLSAGAAPAADLSEGYGYEQPYEEQRYGEERYDEPRYEKGYDGRYEGSPADNGYADGGEGRYDGHGYNGSVKDGPYLPPMNRPPRFAYQDQGQPGCAPRWHIKNELQRRGWENFERLAVRPRVVVLRAERGNNGQAFVLKLDRCTGEIIARRPMYNRGYGSYGPGPRRYGYAY
jgi:hypothetical protein